MHSSPISKNNYTLPPLVPFVLFFVGVLTYLPAILFGGFVYDDRIHIVQNLTLRASDGWKTILFEPVFPGSLYRPVTFLTYWIQAQLGGIKSSHFFLFNAAIHGLNVVLAYAILRTCSRDRALSLVIALFFAVHPLHVEAVANGVGRAELLAFFFGGLGCLLSLKSSWIISAIAFLLAAFSKESGILFPLLTLILFFGANRKISGGLISISLGVLLVALATRYGVLGALTQNNDIPFIDNPIASMPGPLRFLKAFSLMGNYLALHLISYPQSADYSFATITPHFNSISDSLVILFLSLLVVSSTVLFVRRSLFGTGMLWFFGAFLLTGNLFFPIGTSFAERLAYTPSLGVCIAIGSLLCSLESRKKTLLSLICVINLLLTLNYQRHWRDDKTLFSRQVELFPESVKMLVNMSVIEWSNGSFDKARTLIKRALTLYPRSGDAYMVLGAIQAATGEEVAAYKTLQLAIRYQPGHLAALNMLGRLSIRRKDFSAARKYIEAGLILSPHHESLLVANYLLEVAEERLMAAKQVEDKLRRLKSKDREFLAIQSVITSLEKSGKKK